MPPISIVAIGSVSTKLTINLRLKSLNSASASSVSSEPSTGCRGSKAMPAFRAGAGTIREPRPDASDTCIFWMLTPRSGRKNRRQENRLTKQNAFGKRCRQSLNIRAPRCRRSAYSRDCKSSMRRADRPNSLYQPPPSQSCHQIGSIDVRSLVSLVWSSVESCGGILQLGCKCKFLQSSI